MFGVILWSDPEVRKAVVWCEDHGDLAFLNGSALNSGQPGHHEFSFDAGDYIQFDLTVEDDLRRARNPQVVQIARVPHLRDALRPDPDASHSHTHSEHQTGQRGQVITFQQAPLQSQRPPQVTQRRKA